VPVKHRRDQDALLLESVQHKIRKAPQERLVCSQGDDLMALGQALETFDDRVKGKKELEPQPPPLALISVSTIIDGMRADCEHGS